MANVTNDDLHEQTVTITLKLTGTVKHLKEVIEDLDDNVEQTLDSIVYGGLAGVRLATIKSEKPIITTLSQEEILVAAKEVVEKHGECSGVTAISCHVTCPFRSSDGDLCGGSESRLKLAKEVIADIAWDQEVEKILASDD